MLPSRQQYLILREIAPIQKDLFTPYLTINVLPFQAWSDHVDCPDINNRQNTKTLFGRLHWGGGSADVLARTFTWNAVWVFFEENHRSIYPLSFTYSFIMEQKNRSNESKMFKYFMWPVAFWFLFNLILLVSCCYWLAFSKSQIFKKILTRRWHGM